MKGGEIYLAAEDEPGLAVGRRLIAEFPNLSIWREDNCRGAGNLKKKLPKFNRMAESGLPVLALTDLDRQPCPAGMVVDWLAEDKSTGLLFRICVREVEAWLLCHSQAIAEFLGVSCSLVPRAPETLDDPKREIIRLARRSRKRAIKSGLVPEGSARIGPEYNRLLSEFVRTAWIPEVAARSAPSLGRARVRIAELAAGTTYDNPLG